MASRSSAPSDPGGVGRRAALGRLAVLPWLLAACGREAESKLAAGQPLPALTLSGLDGPEQALGGAGRPAVINFWATWCPPCRAEMGGLERLHRRYSAAGLAVQGVAVDTDANLVREYRLREGIGFPILMDPAGKRARAALGIGLFPTTLLVRRDGVVAEVVVGERDWDAGPAHDAVRALL
ncbi:MAG TPA: TlpA disulfide reductase family protein [Rhodocyclaceae bacterium]|nr:TlpA disulfide reductase family protein [Rhodocyclaceae bacterium]